MDNINAIEKLQQNESSIKAMVESYKKSIMSRASDEITSMSPEKQDKFLMKTIARIVTNENLRDCFNSPEGRYSIFEVIDECVATGLELDLHAYAVPYKKKVKRGNADQWISYADFQIRDRGYIALLCGGNKPIFKDIRYGVVHEKERDSVVIDRGTGEVKHIECIDVDKGKVIGIWVQSIGLKDEKEVEYYPITFLEGIRNNHSKTYQRYLSKEISSCAWVTDYLQMLIKTAIKSFCRPYSDVKEALERALYVERNDLDPAMRQNNNISDLADNVVNNVRITLDNIDPEASEPEIKEEKKPDKLF